jgi:trehalose 2-sulfotransferase
MGRKADGSVGANGRWVKATVARPVSERRTGEAPAAPPAEAALAGRPASGHLSPGLGIGADERVRRGYAICAEARSGSIFFSRILQSTGILGVPWEWFHDPVLVRALEADPRQFDALVDSSATPNGVYALKVFSPHFELARKLRWAERLPNLHFVHLERSDLLGQAISLARALQTGQYKADQAALGEARYDRRAIADCLARLAYGRARWHCWFARNGLDPLRLAYEDIVEDPQRAVARVAAHIGLGEEPRADLAKVDLPVQRDSVSEEWRGRFVRESGDLAYLDGGLLFSGRRGGGRLARLFLGPAFRARPSR